MTTQYTYGVALSKPGANPSQMWRWPTEAAKEQDGPIKPPVRRDHRVLPHEEAERFVGGYWCRMRDAAASAFLPGATGVSALDCKRMLKGKLTEVPSLPSLRRVSVHAFIEPGRKQGDESLICSFVSQLAFKRLDGTMYWEVAVLRDAEVMENGLTVCEEPPWPVATARDVERSDKAREQLTEELTSKFLKAGWIKSPSIGGAPNRSSLLSIFADEMERGKAAAERAALIAAAQEDLRRREAEAEAERIAKNPTLSLTDDELVRALRALREKKK